VTIASSTDMNVIKNAQKMLKANSTPEQLKEKLNTKDKVNLMTNSVFLKKATKPYPRTSSLKPAFQKSSRTANIISWPKSTKYCPKARKP
jgi:hypothetical protein